MVRTFVYFGLKRIFSWRPCETPLETSGCQLIGKG